MPVIMNLEKTQKEIIKLFEENKDIFPELELLGKSISRKTNLDNSDKLPRTINHLCKVSKRKMISYHVGKEDSWKKPEQIGINQSGLGTMQYFSKQLSIFGGNHRWAKQRDKEYIQSILTDDKIFNALTKVINKHSIKELKRMRDFYLKNPRVIDNEQQDFTIRLKNENNKEFLKVRFGKYGEINDVSFVNSNNEKDNEYNDVNLIARILNGRKDFEKVEPLEELKKLSSSILEIDFRSLKLFKYICDNKMKFKKLVREKNKEFIKKSKALEKEDEFLDSILKPIVALENL